MLQRAMISLMAACGVAMLFAAPVHAAPGVVEDARIVLQGSGGPMTPAEAIKTYHTVRGAPRAGSPVRHRLSRSDAARPRALRSNVLDRTPDVARALTQYRKCGRSSRSAAGVE